MSLETQRLEFGEFFLDLREKVLLRGGKRLAINPKTYQLLVTLIENHGHLVEKEQLMQALWADSFVEDGNLAFTVSLLRKTLGDDTQNPRYIETVPRRGYRFIAEVRETADGNGSAKNSATPVERKAASSPKIKRIFLTAAALLLLSVFVSGLWYSRNRNTDVEAPILLAGFNSEKLSTDGNVGSAVISPDGTNVIYASGFKVRQSIWLRQLESSNNVQIIPPSENFYFGMEVSPDGQTLYFARVQQNPEDGQQADIYRIPILGGVPTKIVSQAQGSISLSDDGGKISFIRCPYLDNDYCSLWIANSDGKNEKQILSRPRPIRIGTMKFSPDGKTIAFAFGQSRNWANEFSLAEVDIESGVEREITPEKFFNIKRLAWLPNQRGLLLAARKHPDNNFRIWQVSTVTGAIAALTHDSDDYAALSLSRDGGVLVATKNRADFRLNVYQADSPASQPRVLTEASTAGFAANGKIIFSSAMTGNHEVWSINPDGSEQRQLTTNPAMDLYGTTSLDNKFVFFDSNRSGESQVWRMDADGSNQIQITHKVGGFPHSVSPDGNWLYYMSAKDRKLMRVPTNGGEEELVLDKPSDNFAFSVLDKRRFQFALSPDASQVAIAESRNSRTVMTIVSLSDKRTIKIFNLPNEKSDIVQSAWSPDGKSLFYVSPDDNHENYVIWQQPLDGKPPIQIAHLGPDELRGVKSFAISPDGKSFAVIQGSWKHDAVLLRGLR